MLDLDHQPDDAHVLGKVVAVVPDVAQDEAAVGRLAGRVRHAFEAPPGDRIRVLHRPASASPTNGLENTNRCRSMWPKQFRERQCAK
ncbi:MAG: hypothetical protein M3463_23320, partial [Verrucomicrobiota bacterium]|nr:hypothetical protein [Verrucomicrobiota bacterium]